MDSTFFQSNKLFTGQNLQKQFLKTGSGGKLLTEVIHTAECNKMRNIGSV
jgi:hypothetical protein